MGHGAEIVIADGSFPAEACAQRIEPLAGVSATEALAAILSIMPFDS